MKKIRVSKEFSFETAHALDMHDSKCRNIHGHSYKLIVTVLGHINTDNSQPDVGMVIDFTDLKKWFEDDTLEPESYLRFCNEFETQDLSKNVQKGGAIYNAIFNIFLSVSNNI